MWAEGWDGEGKIVDWNDGRADVGSGRKWSAHEAEKTAGLQPATVATPGCPFCFLGLLTDLKCGRSGLGCVSAIHDHRQTPTRIRPRICDVVRLGLSALGCSAERQAPARKITIGIPVSEGARVVIRPLRFAISCVSLGVGPTTITSPRHLRPRTSFFDGCPCWGGYP